jgi:hypothetical protein
VTFAGKMFVEISRKRRADGARTRCAIVNSGWPGIMFDGCLPDPRAARAPAVCYKCTAGLGAGLYHLPFDADGRKMNS